jgi:MoaA/NifB/PqqE/SkfB family radical SAM enzyme
MADMYLAVGYRCNHRCLICPCGNNPKNAPAADVDSLMAALSEGVEKHGVTHVTLSGGEPTLHPAFPLLLQYCMELGCHVTVLSNGDCFSNAEFAGRCFRGTDPDKVEVTTAIHSPDSRLHDRITSIPGSFYRTVQGLENLVRLGIPITVKQCVSQWNYRQLKTFADFVFHVFGFRASLNISGMDFCGMQPTYIRQLAIGYQKMGPYIEEMLDRVTDLRSRYDTFPTMTVADLPLCAVDPAYWGFYRRVSRHSLAQYSAPAQACKAVATSHDVPSDCDTFFSACCNCAVQAYCPGVWRTAYRFFGEGEAAAIPLGDAAEAEQEILPRDAQQAEDKQTEALERR